MATPSNELASYVSDIAQLTQRGDAREESYYAILEKLLLDTAKKIQRTIHVTILPKSAEGGNPDFRIWDGSCKVIGYIEAKAPGTDLDQAARTTQLQRYLHTFPNLILTDFYAFRLYRNGILREQAILARPVIGQTMQTKPPAEQPETIERLLEHFFAFALPPCRTPEALAVELARRARFLRDDVIRPELTIQSQQKQGYLYGFSTAVQHYLMAGLTEDQVADLYAQTITYGLFAARSRAQSGFNRQLAHLYVPATIGMLHNLFKYLSTEEPSPQMQVIIDDIAAVLNAADVQAILATYDNQGKGNDPILHFYEAFLAAYDPATRERRGVYYTPQPVVNYMVRAVHELLQTRFGCADGLADERVTLLDPAAGTLTFPAAAIQLAANEFVAKYGAGAKSSLLRNHILRHFFAFELLMAPYAIGHMKISFLLAALGMPLQGDQRFQFFLANALEMEELEQTQFLGLSSLSSESHQAAQAKKDNTILVILGNPPYSGSSANQNNWTEQLLKTDLDGAPSYYTVDGQPLGEKNPKWLQDDYVKFLRFAQWKIHKAGCGIVAMITNHGYLDNPTFRGMRQSLLTTFDEIYLLDLHGNRLKRETAPDGGPDENVFDIRQGVAIGIFVKYDRRTPSNQQHYQWQTPAEVWRYTGPHARELRKDPTLAEDTLWQRLRHGQLGVKFRRQHCIDRFIVDFYAREPRLIIEVDGPIHETQQEYDAWRQSVLEHLGYRVLRFTNDDVLENVEGVTQLIREAIAGEPPPLTPPPLTGEGHAPSPLTGRGQGGGVYHADLYGLRKQKYEWLETHTLDTTDYRCITPQAPYYFFVPRQTANLQAYLSWPRINELFPVNSVGIVTARDAVAIAFDETELKNRILQFQNIQGLPDDILAQAYGLNDKAGWSLATARKRVQADPRWHTNIHPILYRPFDVRSIFYHEAVIERPRAEVMRHMLAGKNVALVLPRRVEHTGSWQHVFLASALIEHVAVSLKTIDYCFPLYLYPSATTPAMFHTAKQVNFADWLLPNLTAAYGFTPAPEQVLAYIYAICYSPTYRQNYAEELRTDFPRIPFTSDGNLFRAMAAQGQALIDLHVLRTIPPARGVTYQGQGSDQIEVVRYDPSQQRVAINRNTYFEGIKPEVWEYRIGGYHVLEKYLKDRKGRAMNHPVRYIHIAHAIAATIDAQATIDQLYAHVEQPTVRFSIAAVANR